MAKQILDSSAVFSCQKGIGVTFGVLPGQMIAKGNGKNYLNSKTKCKLNMPGQCTLQPNPSGAGYLPCSQLSIPSTAWEGLDQIIKIDGAKALTNDASTMCPLGGKICLQGTCNTIFNVGCSVSIKEIIVEKIEKEHHTNDKKSSSQSVTAIPNEKIDTNSYKKTDGNNRLNKEIIVQDDKAQEKIVSANAKYAKCPYEKCEERGTCPYFNAKVEIDNSSVELKKNFELNRNDEDMAYKKQHKEARAEYSEYGWGYEGHHLISGNQVFMAVDKKTGDLKYGHLLMLANMCGYDINNANNCILLPSMARNEGPWGTLEVFVKEAKAFDVMDIMKRQWHLGGHAYTIPKDSLKYYKPSDSQVLLSGTGEYFPNYATSVQAKLNRINAKYSRKRCWKKLDNQEFKDEFKNTMDETSREIEEMLMRFSKKPKDCYPYFVSKMSVDYAYDAPKTGKIILVYKKGEDIYASKFRVSRKQKDNYQVMVVQNQELPELKIEKNTLQEFVRYCENIMHFWIDIGIDDALPWNCSSEFISNRLIDGSNIYKFACDNATELFTFIDKNEMTNHGQITQIRKRWKEVKENVPICN